MVRFILGRWLFRRVSMSAPGGYDPEVYSRSVTVERVYQNEQAPGYSPGMLLLHDSKRTVFAHFSFHQAINESISFIAKPLHWYNSFT